MPIVIQFYWFSKCDTIIDHRMKKSASSTDAELKKVEEIFLDELNTWISQMRRGWETGGTSQSRRAFFKRLIWLEDQRERLHDIIAPKRRYNRR